MLEDNELMLITYILLNMRKGGYFKGTLEEIANSLRISSGDVKKILDELQRKNIITYSKIGEEEIANNLGEITSTIDKLIMGEEVADKSWVHTITTYTYNYSRRNSLLGKLLHQLSSRNTETSIMEELYRIEKFITPYRRLLNEEIASTKRIMNKEAPMQHLTYDVILSYERLVLKSFPLTRSSLGTLSISDFEGKMNEKELESLKKVVTAIYVVDPSLVDVLKKRFEKFLFTLLEIADKLPSDQRIYVAYSMLSIKKDISLLNRIKKISEVIFK